MDEGSPTLGVGFAIETGLSDQNLIQMQKLMGSITPQIVADAAKIERATGGMVNLGGGTAAVTAFGNATKREYYDLARQKAQTEKSGEALIRQLEREAAAFGKTRSQMRAAKAEEITLAAAKQGNVELVERVRAAEAAIYDKEFAAARRARAEADAAAQAKEAAAAQAVVAAEKEAQAVRSAALAYGMFEAAARRGAAAMREQQAAEEGAANEAIRMAAAAERLRGAIDPAYAAQSRFNREIQEARTLVAANAITLDDYAAKLRMEQAILAGSADAHGRVASSTGANRAAMQGLSYQVQDTMTQLSMGANAFQVIAIQGGQAAGQFANLEGRAGAFARVMIGPVGLGITAATLLLAPFIGKLLDSNSALDDATDKLKKDAEQTGATAEAKARFGNTIAGLTEAIREQQAALEQEATASRSAAERASDLARNTAMLAAAKRDETKAFLEAAIAQERIDSIRAGAPGQRGELGALANTESANRVAALQAQLAEVEKASQAALALVARRNLDIADEQAKKAADPVERIKRAYEGPNGLIAKERERLLAQNATIEVMTRQLGLLRQQEAVKIKAAQDAGRTGTKRDGETLTANAVSRMLRDALPGVHVTSTTGGKHVPNSYHYKNQAVDFVPSGGMASMDKADVRRLFESRGIDVVELLGPGDKGHSDHFHVAWTKGKAALDEFSDAARRTKTQQDDLAGLTRMFDPAKAAADEYQKTLAKIAAAKLDPETATRYADAARNAFVEARAAAFTLPSIDDLRPGQKIADDAEKSAAAFKENVMQPLRDELALYGLVGPARDAAALDLEKQAFMAKNTGEGLAVAALRWQEYYAAKRAIIDKDTEAEAIKRAADELDRMVGAAERAGDAFASAFGRTGGAISDTLQILMKYGTKQAELSKVAKDRGWSEAQKAREAGKLQIETYGDMAGAAKQFFNERSKGYAALATAEKVFRAIQFAMSVKAMAQDAIETGVSLAKSAARTAAHAVEAVAKAIASLPFPANIAAGAATIAALAAIGVSVVGSLGGGGKNTLEKANDGTGSVLGDPSAKSESIKNAIDALKQVDLLTNSYSRQMAASLRSIDSQIGGVASLVARSGDINANAGITQGFKSNATGTLAAIGGIIGGPIGAGIGALLTKIPVIGGILKGLFGSKTSVIGSGLYGGPQSLGSVLNGGFDASYFSDVEKKSKFFGITTGTKYSTQYAGADANLENQFTLILKSFNDAIVAAAGPLGQSTQAIQDRLNGFVISIGKIDLQGLSGAEVQEKLSAIFGKAANGLAEAAFPGMEAFQRVGEGLFETLVRVSSTVEAVTTSLDQLAVVAPQLSIAAKVGLADQFDSVGDFTSAVGAYFEAFYTSEEQAAAKTLQFTKVFASLGVAMPASLAGFRALVEAQNLNTAAGQATYATLLQLAPAFADLQASMAGAKSAADIASERIDLQRQMLQLRGDTAAIRALDLAKVDPSNRALQQQIWDMQDAQEAAKVAQTLADAWGSVGDTIMTEIKRIRGLTDTGGAGFAQLQGQFNAANTAARGGDQDAAKSLPGLSQALLTAAANAATSKQELDRIERQTAASLEATYGVITALTKAGSAGTPSATPESVASAAQGANTSAVANDNTGRAITALQDEMVATRKELTNALAQIAGHTGGIKRTLDNVTLESGGNVIATRAA